MRDKRDEYLTYKEAAARVRMTTRTIANWNRQGKIAVRYTVGGKPLVLESSLWKTTR